MSSVAEAHRDLTAELERLMAQYGTELLRMCALYLNDFALAEDAVQETFLRAYRHLEYFRGACSERTWLSGIAMNICRDYRRTAWFRHTDKRDITALPEPAEEPAWPDDTVLTQVKKLKPRHREVVLMRYYQGLKVKEIADALRLSPGAVKKRLHTACLLLKDQLKEWYDEE